MAIDSSHTAGTVEKSSKAVASAAVPPSAGSLPPKKKQASGSRRGARIWDSTNRVMARLYALIISSWIGRLFTSYRRVERRFCRGRFAHGRERCHTMSSMRLRLVQTISSGHLFAGIRSLFHALFACPMNFFGLFGVTYGLDGIIWYFVLPLFDHDLHFTISRLIAYVALTIISFPMSLSAKSLANTLGSGKFSQFVLVRLLGIPRDRLNVTSQKLPVMLPYLAVLLGVGSSLLSLFIHPLILPLAWVAIGILGLIFTYPEAGVVLSTAILPFVWVHRNTLYVLAAVIILTWISYGIKILFMHRTIRFGLLDLIILLFGSVILLSGFVGVTVTMDTVFRSLFLFICFSDYFLITNLMKTRAYVGRCLFGVAASLIFVTALSYIRLIPPDALSWLEGSRAGDMIVNGFHTALTNLSGMWVAHSELYLVLIFPCLCAYLIHNKRFFRGVWGILFVALDLILVIQARSYETLICIVAATVLFGLLYSHKFLSGLVYSIPVVGCALLWLSDWLKPSAALQVQWSLERFNHEQMTAAIWAILKDHPAGIGAGPDPLAAILPAYSVSGLESVSSSAPMYGEVLLAYGWPGLILLLSVFFVFIQKSLTCLRRITASRDRVFIICGVTAVVSVLLFGAFHSFITEPRLFFMLTILLALCSAYENMIFEETDVLMAETVGNEWREDRVFRTDD